MAIVWMDNFSIYGTNMNLLLDGLYASYSWAGLVNDPDGVSSGRVLQTTSAGALRKVLPSSQTTVGIATRFWTAGLPGNTGVMPQPHRFHDSNGNVQLSISVTPTGALRVDRQDGTVLGQTSGPVIVSNAWQHIETKVVFNATTGSVEIRVEGVQVLNLTNINTINPGNLVNCGIVTIGGNNTLTGAPTTFIKDFVVWDGTGTINNNFLGSVAVLNLMPNADVSSGWSRVGAASDNAALNETPPNDDTSYISAGFGPFPAPSIMDIQDLPVNVTSVRAVMPIARMKKTDGGDGNIQLGIVSGGSTGLGADRPVTTAYTYWSDVIERDPATSAAWLPAAVNNAKIRINRTL